MSTRFMPFNYHEFPFAVILAITSTFMLLLPMYAMYQRKLHFECLSTCLCLFTTLTYLLHDTNDKIPFRNTNMDHSIYHGKLYLGMGVFDWMKLAGITQTFVATQSWVLVCQNNGREFDELLWGAFFIAIIVMYERDLFSLLNVVLPVGVSMLMPIIKQCGGGPRHRISIEKWDLIGICMLWFFCYLFYSLAAAWEYQWEYLLRLHFYTGTAFFAVALYSVAIGVKVQDRNWYVRAYGDTNKEKEAPRRDLPTLDGELGTITGHTAVFGKGEVEYSDI